MSATKLKSSSPLSAAVAVSAQSVALVPVVVGARIQSSCRYVHVSERRYSPRASTATFRRPAPLSGLAARLLGAVAGAGWRRPCGERGIAYAQRGGLCAARARGLPPLAGSPAPTRDARCQRVWSLPRERGG